jgi:mono/diheme cytochrome c family protein
MRIVVIRTLVTGVVLSMFATVCFAADAAAGKAVYERKCKMCHGAAGEGNPGMAKALNITIPPLGSGDVQKLSDADLKKVITEGKGKMKPVAGLSDAEVDNVIAYVRTLKQ